MASVEAEEVVPPTENDSGDGVVWEELPAPPAWKKKVAQRRGGTPRRGDITFVAPDGEEIKSKRQLERYLKSNPGGPAISDFDWSTGETPRRSERLSSRKRFSDVEAEPTTPKRGRRKKNASTPASAPAGAEKSDEEPAGKEEEPVADEETKEQQAQEEAEKEEKEEKEVPAPAAGDEAAEVAEAGDAPAAAAPPSESVEDKSVEIPLSCAKTETLNKSQETQPTQIGVS